MRAYPWYGWVESDEPLEQGDFFDSCPVIVPTTDVHPGTIQARVDEYDVVVLSQSCDLVNGKIELVQVAPVWLLSEFQATSEKFKKSGELNKLRQGNYIGYHLLHRCDLSGTRAGFRHR
ncbi:MAG: hypothetical protein H0X37_20630 [Herpetosiphonaceae bacterium]|nr:hypothetical protein [Herpetosiphonaceae bacterium]